jgi:hypothetical protein
MLITASWENSTEKDEDGVKLRLRDDWLVLLALKVRILGCLRMGVGVGVGAANVVVGARDVNSSG